MKARGDLGLAIGYWIVSHKAQLRAWWAILLLGFLGLSFVWVIVFFSIFFGQQTALDDRIASAAAALGRFRVPASFQPSALETGSVNVLQRDQTHADLVVSLTNRNTDWGARGVTYHFVVDGKRLPTRTTFLNPGATRPVVELNVATGRQAELVIDDVDWARAATAIIPPPVFSVESVTLTPVTVRLGTQSILTVNVSAEVMNRSVYSFLNVRVPITVKNGSTVVAVDEQIIDRWPTLTARTIVTTWTYPVAATTADLAPQVSQFDPEVLRQ